MYSNVTVQQWHGDNVEEAGQQTVHHAGYGERYVYTTVSYRHTDQEYPERYNLQLFSWPKSNPSPQLELRTAEVNIEVKADHVVILRSVSKDTDREGSY